VAANVVTGSTIAVNNLLRCMDAINVTPDELVPEPLAVGRAVLTEEEGEFGTLVIDLGGSTSDASIFHGGNLIYNCSLPVGGNQISNDLAFGLRAGFAAAEELKVRYGSTIARAREQGEIVSASAGSPTEVVRVEQRVAAEIIDARLAETFELVQEQILRSGYADCYPGGVVLTGGTSQIRGSAELAREVLGVPSRVSAGLRLQGLADAVQGPSYATSVGLVAWGREQMAAAPAQDDSRLDRWLSAIKAWFRNFA
jgi:cell division protein FtsA